MSRTMQGRLAATAVILFSAMMLAASAQPPPMPPMTDDPPSAPAPNAGTIANLQKALEMESDASARYQAFASKADEEGYKGIGTLFRAMALSEDMRAKKRVAMMKKLGAEPASFPAGKPQVWTTKENLESAIKAQTEAKDAIYPAFAKQAEADGVEGAIVSLKGASAVLADAIKLCQQALGNMEAWKAGREMNVCGVCSLVMTDRTIEKCPVCDTPKIKFEPVK